MANSRVTRGRQTEQLVADYLAAGPFPHAERRPASLPGSDIVNTPGYSIEVKARRAFNPKAWVKQSSEAARKMDGNGNVIIPVVVMRPDGMGEASIDEWPTFVTLDDWAWMVGRIQHLERELYGE